MENTGMKNLECILPLINLPTGFDAIKGFLFEIFKDITGRCSKEDILNPTGMELIPFQNYFQLPLIISEKIFHALDTDQKGFLNESQFVEGIFCLSAEVIHKRIKLVFEIFDIDRDGVAQTEDITLLLSHFHVIRNQGDISILYQILDNFYCNRKYFRYLDFVDMVTKVNSDAFILFLLYYSYTKPFDRDALNFYSQQISGHMPNEDGSVSPQMRRKSKTVVHCPERSSDKTFSNYTDRFISLFKVRSLSESPDVETCRINDKKFSSIADPSELLCDYINEHFSLTLPFVKEERIETETNFDELNSFEDEMRRALAPIIQVEQPRGNEFLDISKDMVEDESLSSSSFEKQIKEAKFFISRSSKKGVRHSSIDMDKKLHERNDKAVTVCSSVQLISNISICTGLTSYSDFQSPIESDTKSKSILSQSYKNMYTFTVSLEKRNRMKKYKMVFMGDTLFFFKNIEHLNGTPSRTAHLKRIQTLRKTFIGSSIKRKVNNDNYFAITLTSELSVTQSSMYIYFNTYEAMSQFESLVKNVTNFRNITDYYSIESDIGHGQFGKIQLGVNKTTKEKVAIKIIAKSFENIDDYQMIRWECDITKFLLKASHPGIIKAKDYFETAGSIYLVYEYIAGGSLNTYLWKTQKVMKKIEIEIIIKQILESFQFLFKFGIIHRDLKPENILLSFIQSGNTHLIQTKLIDFGLSKVMSIHEKTSESYGSLCYSSPEIIIRRPYNYKIDIWSLGVLIYYLYYAELPFDDPRNDLISIAKKILLCEYSFPKNTRLSNDTKIMNMIKSCLQKNWEKRPNIIELSEAFLGE